jgi:hypothetical protein
VVFGVNISVGVKSGILNLTFSKFYILKLCSDLIFVTLNFCERVFGGVYFKFNHRNLVKKKVMWQCRTLLC